MTLRCNLEGKYYWDVRTWQERVYQTHYLYMKEILLVDYWRLGRFECEVAYWRELAP